jgi:YVTN family beta-propeller protein
MMSSSLRCLRACLPAVVLLAGILGLSCPARASAEAARSQPARSQPARSQPARSRAVGHSGSGGNLLVNPRGTDGAYSAQGWDAVTIPGWQVSAGLPTVVRYGTAGFPTAAGRWPASRGQIFAGGAGGTARLVQRVALHLPSGAPAPSGTGYQVSAWLGGTATSWAEVVVRFMSATDRPLGSRTIGPVGRDRRAEFAPRAGSGVLPAGTTSAQVTIVLATSLTDYNGPDAPQTGYNPAVAADLSLTVTAPVIPPAALTPPTAQVPRYQHVFLFYFENEDFGQIIGNTKQAPYLNSLLRQGSVLSQFYAEEHPSDGNYLALAGGSTFGIPLDDPEEENPQYTISAPNIGDLIDSAHETWKAYPQSANGPCDDTVHTYYWNDDQPMMYFADVRDRPAYCAAHVTPLESLPSDLASAATTPNFAWIAPNDCTDMEGCGISAGDKFLAQELGMIMDSPAWLTQPSLAIITFDEDAQDYQHPAQRVPTIILGSTGVRQGYVSSVRYTHYSLLRTIEAALGLGTLTDNDRYAQPVNDVFDPGQADPATGTAAGTTETPVTLSASGQASAGQASAGQAGSSTRQPVAWVANYGSATVTPVNLTSRKAGKAIGVGTDPQAVVVTPNGRTVYVANSGSGTVTPIDTATGRAGPPIPVGTDPVALAVTPNGRTVYVANSGSGTVTPIDTATGRAGPPIPVGAGPRAIALTPDGRTAYVVAWEGGTVTPIDTATDEAGQPIQVGSFPSAIVISPRGGTAYVANYGSDTVTPITIATQTAGRPIPAGYAPDALAVTSDGRDVYAVDGNSDEVTPIVTATGRPGRPMAVGYSPVAVTMSASGSTAYVVSSIAGTVTPLAAGSGRTGSPISVGLYSYPTGLTLTGSVAVVLDTYAGQITMINTRTQKASAPVTVGSFPVAVAISG